MFEFTVHVFGLASSPCVAMRVVREHAERHKGRWPVAEEALRTSSLVDDVWFASSDPEELKRGMEEIVDLTGSMGIHVHKWGSNLEELIKDVPHQQRARTFQINCEGQGALKALGVAWDTQTDEFLFLQGPPKMDRWTLRTMSSSAGQLYDPLGLISPTTLPGKLLIQSAWRYQQGWDEQSTRSARKENGPLLPESTESEWDQISKAFRQRGGKADHVFRCQPNGASHCCLLGHGEHGQGRKPIPS